VVDCARPLAGGLTTDLGAEMSREQDVAAARAAVDELERACVRLLGHFRENVDSRRLRMDVSRLRDDLSLVCGREPAAEQGQQSPSVIWGDGMDESTGAPGRTAR
jgi:hypothetical protein